MESVLRTHPGVRGVAVDTHDEGGAAGTGLIAYLVCDLDLRAPSLRSFLSRLLPSFMIPRRFVRLDELPLTATGKVAYARLAPSLGAPLGSEFTQEAPSLHLERQIAEIWRELLGVEVVRSEDDFL